MIKPIEDEILSVSFTSAEWLEILEALKDSPEMQASLYEKALAELNKLDKPDH